MYIHASSSLWETCEGLVFSLGGGGETGEGGGGKVKEHGMGGGGGGLGVKLMAMKDIWKWRLAQEGSVVLCTCRHSHSIESNYYAVSALVLL